MNFSEEMKMQMQIRQLTEQNQKKANLQAVQDDYSRLLQKLLSDLKEQIRSDMEAGIFTLAIEGDFALPIAPKVPCAAIPQLEEPQEMFSYQTADGIPHFCWADICLAIKDGKRLASKNISMELTEAGKRLLDDFSGLAAGEGIQLVFQPAVDTRHGKFILPKFGQYENVPKLKRGKIGNLNGYFVNVHYKIV